jgi:hypothetical protein
LPLAVVAAQAARRVEPPVRAEIDSITEQLIPPETDSVAEALAGTGEPLIAMLRARPPQTSAQAKSSIHALSAVGGPAALAAIAEILAAAEQHWDSGVTAAVVRAWRFFKPAEYMEQVLVRSWPRDRELLVTEPAYLEVLPMLAGLTAVECELGNFGGSPGLGALALCAQLRRVTLTGCAAGLDLAPLYGLVRLRELSLRYRGEAADSAPLAALPGLRHLTLACQAAAGALDGISDCPALLWFELFGCGDVRSLGDLPVPPPSAEGVSLSGFGSLKSLAGAEHWTTLRALELFDCPSLTDLGPLAGMTALERIGLGTAHAHLADLSPLAALPRLREVTLMGNWSFDVSGLRGASGLQVRVPVGSALAGADGLGAGVTLSVFDVPSRLVPSAPG